MWNNPKRGSVSLGEDLTKSTYTVSIAWCKAQEIMISSLDTTIKANVHRWRESKVAASSRMWRLGLGVAMVWATKKKRIVVITLNCILNFWTGVHHDDCSRTYRFPLWHWQIFIHGDLQYCRLSPKLTKNKFFACCKSCCKHGITGMRVIRAAEEVHRLHSWVAVIPIRTLLVKLTQHIANCLCYAISATAAACRWQCLNYGSTSRIYFY